MHILYIRCLAIQYIVAFIYIRTYVHLLQINNMLMLHIPSCKKIQTQDSEMALCLYIMILHPDRVIHSTRYVCTTV